MANTQRLICDTCGREVDHLRRDVIDAGYNALTKPPMWNCEACYQAKRRRRLADTEADTKDR